MCINLEKKNPTKSNPSYAQRESFYLSNPCHQFSSNQQILFIEYLLWENYGSEGKKNQELLEKIKITFTEHLATCQVSFTVLLMTYLI